MKFFPRIPGLVAAALLAACISIRPPVVVTLTPAPTTPASPMVELPTTVPTFTSPPTTLTVTSTAMPIPPAGPTPTFGPVIGPDYFLTLTSTFTPVPTDTPPGPSPTPLPVLRSDMMGVQIHPFIEEDELIDLLNRAKFDLGVRWIKFQAEWELLEPHAGERGVQFQILERFIQHCHDRGFEVLLSVVSAPDWTRTPVSMAEYPNDPFPEEGPPDDYQHFANFVNDLAQRFDNRVDAIELWNEPNLHREWFGKPLGGAEYMRMFDAAYRAVRGGTNPTITLVTAGLAPTGINDHATAVDDRVFLSEMYAAGLAGYQNVVVGVHPYGWANPPTATCATDCDPSPERGWDDQRFFFFLDTLNDYRAIMVQHGDDNRQLWVTEFGWPTFDGFGVEPDAAITFFSYLSEQDQANYIIDALSYGQSQIFIGEMFLWNLNWALFAGRDGIQSLEQEAGYALIRPDGSPRPAYELLRLAPKE
jgi:hypothetical protein